MTVKEAAQPVVVDISDDKVREEIADKRKLAETVGEAFNLVKISDDIEIEAILSTGQDPPFAKDNANLEGPDVGPLSFMGGKGIEKKMLVHRPIGYRDVEGQERALAEAKHMPFPGLDAQSLSRLVVNEMPEVVKRSISNPEFQQQELPLDRTGSVQNDLGELCAYEQHSLVGVNYFYPHVSGVVAPEMGVAIFNDPICMRAHIPGRGLAKNAQNINLVIGYSWYDTYSYRAHGEVSELRMPTDNSLEGLCMTFSGEVLPVPRAVLIQYVIHAGAIVAVLHAGYGACAAQASLQSR
jgi:hypothetical protein